MNIEQQSEENILEKRTVDILKILIKLSSDIDKIKNDINQIKSNMNISNKIPTIFDKVDRQCEEKFVLEMLNTLTMSSDIKLLKSIYLIEDLPSSIKYNNNDFLYWNGNDWIKNDSYFFKILLSKITQKYHSVNVFKNFESTISKLINNQNYINKIGTKTYMTQFKKKLKVLLE
tara:strand:- start:5 stop:526 length:522 start_codon:yes stop_codon:yes gene_type:complete